MPMSGLNVLNSDCPAAITPLWLHSSSVCALNVPSVNPVSVSRLIRHRSGSNTLGVGLGADIGSRRDPVSFGLIVF